MRKIAMVKLVTWYLGVTKILSFELVFSLLFVSDFEIIGGPHCNNLLVFWQIHPKTLKKYFWSESIILNLIDDTQFFVFSFHEDIKVQDQIFPETYKFSLDTNLFSFQIKSL